MDLTTESKEFLSWLGDWYSKLAPMALGDVVVDPARTAVASVDLINGFAYQGNLSSPRVAALVPAVVELFTRAHARGVRNFILVQECHSANAEEFKSFAPHGVCGTAEALTIPELAKLPFADEFVTVHKNSLHTITGTTFETWIDAHPEVDTYIVAGDCTDLCTYDMAMDLKLRANAVDQPRRVIVAENLVNTYDLPVPLAKQLGALPHDGNFLHVLFLYMMALNSIEIIREIKYPPIVMTATLNVSDKPG